MKIEETNLDGVLLLKPQFFKDDRGFFLESYNKDVLNNVGINPEFVQDNHSRSSKNVLRGLHFQKENPQGKLVRCSNGRVFDVVVDINPSSNTFKDFFCIELNDENNYQLWIPPGYAHGFCCISSFADFNYKCTDFYFPNDQHGIIWNDPEIGIPWPVSNPIISKKDLQYSTISEYLKF